jgi:hypothetical protein
MQAHQRSFPLNVAHTVRVREEGGDKAINVLIVHGLQLSPHLGAPYENMKISLFF